MATRVTLREIADAIDNPGSGLNDLLKRILKDMREERAKARRARLYLIKLVRAVEIAIAGVDVANGRIGAEYMNQLEFVKDEAKHFGLGRPL